MYSLIICMYVFCYASYIADQSAKRDWQRERGYQKGSSGFFVVLLRFVPFSNQTSDRPSSPCILDLLCRLDCMRLALPGESEQHTALG